MRIVSVGKSGGGIVTLTIPSGCTAVTNFISVGNQLDPAGGDNYPRVYLSPNPADTYATIEAGNSVSVIARANSEFPPIPVSAGETLLVIGSALAWGALIYLAEE